MAILLIDLDDTVADLTGKVLDLYEEDTGIRLDPNKLTSWEENGRVFKDYYLQKGIYLELDVMPNAVEVLESLSKQHRIFFVTAAPTPESSCEKKQWVDKHFPFIGQMNVITTRDKYLINGDLLLDDSPIFLPSFKGIRVLVDKPHNSELEEAVDFDEYVFDMGEFYSYVRRAVRRGKLKVSTPEELARHAEKPLGQD